MKLSLIVAMTEDRVIGVENRLPWHLSEDLKRFKKLTWGHSIVMGRRTFDSIGKPLPGRHNIVLTKSPNFSPPGVTVQPSLENALQLCEQEEKVFAIGGARVFSEVLPLADVLYITFIHHPFEGDTFFPPVDLERDFRIVEEVHGRSEKGDRLSYTFLTAERIQGAAKTP